MHADRVIPVEARMSTIEIPRPFVCPRNVRKRERERENAGTVYLLLIKRNNIQYSLFFYKSLFRVYMYRFSLILIMI